MTDVIARGPSTGSATRGTKKPFRSRTDLPARSPPIPRSANCSSHSAPGSVRTRSSGWESCARESIAIVGASPNAARASYFVGTYLLQSSDYRVYFVNPMAEEILGHKAYPDLASLPEVPDIVDVFRKGSDIPSVIDEVLAVGAKTIWVQLGIWNQDAAIYGESKGLTVVMDRCIKIEHARFNGGLHLLGFDTGQITSRKTIR